MVDQNSKIINSTSGTISLWPSSTHAEIFSLFTAILTCPTNSVVNIYLDSQAAIDGFNIWKQKSGMIRSYLKINNHSIWESIFSTIEKYKLTIIIEPKKKIINS